MGGCSGFPSCFLGLLGFSVFLVRSAPVVGVGGGLRGVPGFGVWCARVSCFLFVGGAGLGCVCARPVPELSGSGCGRVRWSGAGVRVARFPWWGSGCARFPVRVRGVVVVFAGGFRVLFFPSGASRVFWFCGAWSFVGLWFPRGWGVVGGVGLGWGCFFSGFCCTGPGLFPVSFVGAGSGLGWVLFGEFDPGSGRTLAACLTHASRTGPPLWGWVEWRTGEYHVSNLPPAPG